MTAIIKGGAQDTVRCGDRAWQGMAGQWLVAAGEQGQTVWVAGRMRAWALAMGSTSRRGCMSCLDANRGAL